MFEYWQIITGGATLIGGAIGWIFSSKVRKSDAKEKESNALSSMQKAYDTWTSHTNQQISILQNELAETRKELLELKGDIKLLNKDNRELHREINGLRKENGVLKDRIFELEKDNNRKAQENIELKARLKNLTSAKG